MPARIRNLGCAISRLKSLGATASLFSLRRAHKGLSREFATKIYSGVSPSFKSTAEALAASPNDSMPCNFVEDTISHWAAAYPQRAAIRCVPSNTNHQTHKINYADLDSKSMRIAHLLLAVDIKKGDRVALLLNQEPAFLYDLASLIKAGVIAVPVSEAYKKNLMSWTHALRAKGVILNGPQTSKQVGALEAKVASPVLFKPEGSCNRYISLRVRTPPSASAGRTVETTSLDPALCVPISASPKAETVTLTQADLYRLAHSIGIEGNDVVYNPFYPGCNFGTALTAIGAWAAGAESLLTPSTRKLTPRRILQHAERQGVTVLPAHPELLSSLVKDRFFPTFSPGTLRRVVSIGRPDKAVVKDFERKGIEVVQVDPSPLILLEREALDRLNSGPTP